MVLEARFQSCSAGYASTDASGNVIDDFVWILNISGIAVYGCNEVGFNHDERLRREKF